MKKEEVKIVSADGHVVHGTRCIPENIRASALLVHGITADRHEWGFFDALMQEFGESEVATLAIDYRGHGMSDIPIEQLSLSGVMIDVTAAWNFLREVSPATQSIIVGNSFGGGIAYLFGQNAEDCSHVYLTCPVTSYVSDVSRVNSHWIHQAKTGFIRYASKQLGAFIVPEFYAYDFLIAKQKVSIPFSVIHGAEDSDVPPEESRAFLASRANPHMYHSLSGMDHSFSAPAGSTDADSRSPLLRKEAAHYIATILDLK